MNMKTAQDISPSAIVCLSLGLLIGNVLLPEHQISGYISWQPSMEPTGKVATGVDVSKGRLLERLPDYSEPTDKVAKSYSPGVLSEALSPPLAGVGTASFDKGLGQEALVVHTSSQELTDLVARITGAYVVLASDWIVMLVLGAFAVLAIPIMKVDVDEMVAQVNQDVEYTKAEVTQTKSKGNGWLSLKTIIFICAAGLSAFLAVSTSLDAALVQEPSLMPAGTQELTDLVARIAQADFSLAPDWIVMTVLGAFAVLAIPIMKIDMDEMAEPVEEDVKHTEAENHQTTGKDQGQLTLQTILFVCALGFSAVGLIVGSTSLDTAVGQEASLVHANTQELTDLVARIAQAEFALAPDWIVMLVLVAFTVLSMVVMKIDMDEMAEQVQEDVKHTEAEIAQPTSKGNGWLSLETIFFVCAGLIVGSASLDTALSQEASLMHPSTQELTDLVARMALSEFAFAPDWIVILVLGALTVLSMVVMKIDMDEMSEQVKEDVKHTEVEVAQVQEDIKHTEVEVHQTTGKDNGWPSLTDIIFICAAFLIVGSASLDTALGQEASLMSASTQELTDLVARIAQADFVLAPDWIVILVLGAFTVLSKVVMKSDMDEMAEQVKKGVH